MWLFPLLLMQSGSIPVLAFKSPHSSTCPWAWKWLISVWRMWKKSSS
uniref:Uncharacterized protein n=1 Tax=Anguilla anguilla TaxID=7936 RepID=A0A0E9XNC4_ANGAN